MDFYRLNSEFQDVKAEAINIVSFLKKIISKNLKFLANEYLNLRKHISERTLNILKQTQAYEESNKQKLYMNLIEEASKTIDKVYFGEVCILKKNHD